MREKYIIVKIMGGLGNQFFTYATAYSLARDSGARVILDPIIYQTTYSLRTCQLFEFNIEDSNILINLTLGRSKVAIKIFNIVHNMFLKLKYNPTVIEEKEHFKYQKIKQEEDRNLYIKGYWQNYRYFDNYRKELIGQFLPKELSSQAIAVENKLKSISAVAIHVRRSDYKNYQGGKCLSITYYMDAIKYVLDNVDRNAIFCVFTDDVEYCKEKFHQLKNIIYCSEMGTLSDIEELYVMSRCEQLIIANSSFSWWAAYLSGSNNVVVPIVDFWQSNFYLSEWHQIETELE